MEIFEFVRNLGAGWNLGDTFDSISKRAGDSRPHETRWGNPVTTQAMINTVRDAGFSLFRFPVTWFQQTDSDFVINEAFLARVREVVEYGLSAGMTVILNQHHERWTFPSDENFPAASARLAKTWTQIANYFADAPETVLFESMNEPRKTDTDVEWNGGDDEGRRVVMQLNRTFVEAVRATGGANATRRLIVPNYAASAEEAAMRDFDVPDANTIASIHAYKPYAFALSDDFDAHDWKPEYEAVIDQLFERINEHLLSRKIPVIMGETGARRKHDNVADRVKWADYYTRKAREYGIPCCWWDNGHLTASEKSDSFGLLNRKTLTWEYPEIAKAFVAGQA